MEQVQTRCHLNTPRVIGSSGGDQPALHCLSPFYFVSKSHGLDIFAFCNHVTFRVFFSHFLFFLSAGLLGTYIDGKVPGRQNMDQLLLLHKKYFDLLFRISSTLFCFSWQTLLPLLVHKIKFCFLVCNLFIRRLFLKNGILLQKKLFKTVLLLMAGNRWARNWFVQYRRLIDEQGK